MFSFEQENLAICSWRVCWVIGPKQIISTIQNVGSFLEGGANHPYGFTFRVFLFINSLRSLVHSVSIFLSSFLFPLDWNLKVTDCGNTTLRIRVCPAGGEGDTRHIQGETRLCRKAVDRNGYSCASPTWYCAPSYLLCSIPSFLSLSLIILSLPESTFYCWADLSGLPPGLENGLAFFEEALKFKVILVPGIFFGIRFLLCSTSTQVSSTLPLSFHPSPFPDGQ